MTPALALHTAARRYCLDQFAYWWSIYSEILEAGRGRASDGYNYSEESLRVFPRYNLMRAVRIDVERLDPDSLNDVDQTRELLNLCGQTADDAFTRKPICDIDAESMSDERRQFSRFLAGLTEADLRSVEPLPYRRVLSTSESTNIWSSVRSHWDIRGQYWYPLEPCSQKNVVAFEETRFWDAISEESLAECLQARSIHRLWELRESEINYELDTECFSAKYNGDETYWTTKDFTWIIYVSHEGTITLGGWLLTEIQQRWPAWEQSAWHPA